MKSFMMEKKSWAVKTMAHVFGVLGVAGMTGAAGAAGMARVAGVAHVFGVLGMAGVLGGALSSCSGNVPDAVDGDAENLPSRSVMFNTGMTVGVAPWRDADSFQYLPSDGTELVGSRASNQLSGSRASNQLSEYASTIHFYDFFGGKMAQKRTEDSSGSFAAMLPFGEHDLRFLAHSSGNNAPNIDATLFAPEKVTETFLCNEKLVVNGDLDQNQVVKMNRVVGEVVVKIVDEIPAGVSVLKLTLGNYCGVLNLTNGDGISEQCRMLEREWNIGSSLVGKKGQLVGAMTFVPTGGLSTSVRIEAKNAQGETLYARETKTVPVEKNRSTVASCVLFRKGGNFTFEVAEDWKPGMDVEMEEEEVVSKSETGGK